MAAVDFVSNLFLVFFLLAMLLLVAVAATRARPSVPTPGEYAVVITWPARSDDDVDLWVQSPQGELAWYGARQSRSLHLEMDDLGHVSDSSGRNRERTVIRVAEDGEYAASVHLYRQDTADGIDPVPVRAELWRLAGTDRRLLVRRVILAEQGQEQTLFRWTLRRGRVVDASTLPKRIVTLRRDTAALAPQPDILPPR
jgi:hypothetical protein